MQLTRQQHLLFKKNRLKHSIKTFTNFQEFRARADQRGQDTGASPVFKQGDRQHKQVEVGGSVPPPRTTLRRRPAGEESYR